MEETIPNKRHFVSEPQKRALISLLENEEELIKGKFSQSFTHKMAQEKWEKITGELYAIPGACKSSIQWKRTWQDMKKNVKKKKSNERKYTQEIGGGRPLQIITEDEENILGLLETTAVEGDQNVAESSVLLFSDNEDMPLEKGIVDDSNKENVAETPASLDNMTSLQAPSSREATGTQGKRFTRRKKQKLNMKTRNLQSAVKVSEEFLRKSEQQAKTQDEYRKQKLEMTKDYYEQRIQLEKEKNEIQNEQLVIQRQVLNINENILNVLNELI